MSDVIAEFMWPRTGRGWRFAARIVRRQRFGLSFGARIVGAHDNYPLDGWHVWVYGSVGRIGFGIGVE